VSFDCRPRKPRCGRASEMTPVVQAVPLAWVTAPPFNLGGAFLPSRLSVAPEFAQTFGRDCTPARNKPTPARLKSWKPRPARRASPDDLK